MVKQGKMSQRAGRSHDRDRQHRHDNYGHRHRRDYDYDDYDDRASHRSSRHRSRSRSPGHGRSRHHSEHHSRSHRSKNHRESPDHTKSRYDSHHHQSKHGTASDSKVDKRSKCESSKELSGGPKSISAHQRDIKNYCSGYETGTSDEPKAHAVNVNEHEHDPELEKEKERVQRETMERLQKHFEKEGKAYPPPKPQASHPIFANDGSFLEIFKKTIQQQQPSSTTMTSSLPSTAMVPATVTASATATESQTKTIIPAAGKSNTTIPMLPVKRRGAKILKTGIVQKQRIVEADEAQPADSWNAYLKEVKRYKTVTCSDDNMTRSLVK